MSDEAETPITELGQCGECKGRWLWLYRGECASCIADRGTGDNEPPICALLRTKERVAK